MNLFSGIFIICALVTTVSALKCFSCTDPIGNCTQKEAVCNSAANHTCTALSVILRVGGINSSMVSKGCGICPEPISINTGFFALSRRSSCCSSDLCNGQYRAVEQNTTLNGLECFGCLNVSFDTCVSSTSIVKCVGIQDRCLHDASTQLSPGNLFILKGCVSENLCRFPKSSAFGVQTTSDSSCCQGNLCNNATTLPGLKCHTCVGVPGNCRTQTIHCTSSNCRTLNYKQVNGGKTQELLINGCGNCTGILSFSSGEFSTRTADRCCQTDLCNNETIAEEANTTLNGLECYGCSPISNKTCEDPMERVKCVGEQKWCVHTSATRNFTQIIIKGCASESICKNPDVVKPFGIVPKQDFYCCKESWCNRGSVRSEVSTVPTNTVGATSNSPTVQQTVGATSNSPTVQQTVGATSNSPTVQQTVAATNYSPAVHQSLSLLTLPLITLILCLF
ncbi:uncharacterized protein [Heptranchias perlo]|uniref:uncharacterized protein n=1 Tax=Heptranchias perlo TaxID=212740 RepID=UPI00355A1B22